jgi:hypothetical protein
MEKYNNKEYPSDYQPLDVLVARVMDGEIIEEIEEDGKE